MKEKSTLKKSVTYAIILLIICFLWNVLDCAINIAKPIDWRNIITLRSIIFSVVTAIVLSLYRSDKCTLALLFAMLFLSACKSDDNLIQTHDTKIEERFNKFKVSTLAHNTMLENTFKAISSNHSNTQMLSIKNESDLDQFINLFIEANESIITSSERRNEQNINQSFSFLKNVVTNTRSISMSQTRFDDNQEMPQYMNCFLNKIFNGEDFENTDPQIIHEEILTALSSVLNEYPDLTEDEINGLFFTAGVTFNSCIYWSENANLWIAALTHGTRSDIWDALAEGVKNGVKKWAKADATGAVQAWLGNRVLAVASTGTSLLAGAAVSSAWGAVENATTL